MSTEIIDEYHRLVNPDIYKGWNEAREMLPVLKFLSELTPEQILEIQRKRWRLHLSKFDHGVLEAVGFSVDDLIDARYQRLKERAAGKNSPKSERRLKQREKVLLAIRDADRSGKLWSEVISDATQASQMLNGQEVDRKTIDRWLRELHEWGLISIQPPPANGRGRPRKRE